MPKSIQVFFGNDSFVQKAERRKEEHVLNIPRHDLNLPNNLWSLDIIST